MKDLAILKKEIMNRKNCERDERKAFKISRIKKAADKYPEGPAAEITLEYFMLYQEDFTPYVNPDMCLAGEATADWLEIKFPQYTADIGHYCADYALLIREGVGGIRNRISLTEPYDEESAQTKGYFLRAMELFSDYIGKHFAAAEAAASVAQGEQKERLMRTATNLRNIQQNKPESFIQGLQLVWLAHAYVMLKPFTNAVAIGTLDRTLGELYEHDTENGILTDDEALRALCEFILLINSCDRDTQNIALGGSDENGNPFENALTGLIIRAQREVHCEQPSVLLKVTKDTSDEVWDNALSLLREGGGMPAFINDELVRKSLVKQGFSESEANTFCIVGCYEATPYGNTYGGTVTGYCFILPQVFCQFFVSSDNAEEYDDFESFIKGWEKYLDNYYRSFLAPGYRSEIEYISTRSASPFLGCIMDGCIENLCLPEKLGAEHNIKAVTIGGIGTITDCLLCVRHFVYETGEYTLSELRRQVAGNYPDDSVRMKLRNYPDRFGTNGEKSNAMARRETLFLSDLIRSTPIYGDVIPHPALFVFESDIYADWIKATPDGRRNGERYSYGASGSEFLPRRDLTHLLSSCASLPLDLFPDGAPMSLNLSLEAFKDEKGRAAVRTLVETFFSLGGFHLHINVADPEVLRDAQRHPEQYTDLLIRVSGHTEPFIRLDKTLQDALITRAALGR